MVQMGKSVDLPAAACTFLLRKEKMNPFHEIFGDAEVAHGVREGFTKSMRLDETVLQSFQRCFSLRRRPAWMASMIPQLDT